MPRLTNLSLLVQARQLRDHCHSDSGAFPLLAPREQWALHIYYLLTDHLTDPALIDHREDISFLDRSLPQHAGRSFARWNKLIPVVEAYVTARREAPIRTKGAPTKLWVVSEVNPHLDADRIAKVLLSLEREDLERNQ
jgi:hypothetical protein